MSGRAGQCNVNAPSPSSYSCRCSLSRHVGRLSEAPIPLRSITPWTPDLSVVSTLLP